MATRPFIPRDKPRPWIVFVLAVIVELGFGLVSIVGAWLKIEPLYRLGYASLISAWAVGVVAFITLCIGAASGRYRNLAERDWKDQVWNRAPSNNALE